ncbi:uncharacterized protein LOC142318221 [Lycorma delicatula]|uniref:uncharacterized protein LOC142318221 n=1 Tax=Lycorma delicatula TaxID=130591 RepID=UPI003F51249E
MTGTTLSFCELVDLAVGVPTVNSIHLNILHSLLEAIILKFGLSQHKLEFLGDGAKQIQEIKEESKHGKHKPFLKYHVIEPPEMKLEKDSQSEEKKSTTELKDSVNKTDEIHRLENKVKRLSSHVDAISLLPQTKEIIDSLKARPDSKPILDMVNNTALLKRVTALEEGSDKMKSIIDNICRNQNRFQSAIKEIKEKTINIPTVDDNYIKKLGDSQSKLEDDFHALSHIMQQHFTTNDNHEVINADIDEIKGKISKLEIATYRASSSHSGTIVPSRSGLMSPHSGICSSANSTHSEMNSVDRLLENDFVGVRAWRNKEWKKAHMFSYEQLQESEKRKYREKLVSLSKIFTILDPSMGLSWFAALENEFSKLYFKKLNDFLVAQKITKIIFPPENLLWTWTKHCKVEDVKVVILAEEPYYNLRQANGLAYSVPVDEPIPACLQNIFVEIKNNFKDYVPTNHGNLIGWALQGVLLLNSVLTVECKKPNSHKHQGWELLTTALLKYLNDYNEGIVFMLWGSYAQRKANAINSKRHYILKSAHPSPVTATRGFFGNRHFFKCNEFLKRHGKTPIQWDWLPKEDPTKKKNEKKSPPKVVASKSILKTF